MKIKDDMKLLREKRELLFKVFRHGWDLEMKPQQEPQASSVGCCTDHLPKHHRHLR